MLLTVAGRDLPGLTCEPYTQIEIGVQRGKVAEQWWPADAANVSWALELSPKESAAGPDVRGPHVQGRPGARFVYLVWSGRRADGAVGMFRRLKIPLDPSAPPLAGALDGGTATVELSLTGRDGTPRCGGLKPGDVHWLGRSESPTT